MIADANGNLFGDECGRNGQHGTVFEIGKTTSGYASTPTTLINFTGANGANPLGSVIAEANGDVFGTTKAGGTANKDTANGIADRRTLVPFRALRSETPI